MGAFNSQKSSYNLQAERKESNFESKVTYLKKKQKDQDIKAALDPFQAKKESVLERKASRIENKLEVPGSPLA